MLGKVDGTEGVCARFFVGTPTAVKYVPLAEKHQITLVGLFTGVQTLYTPLRHWVINVRASYFDETREEVRRAAENLALPQDCSDLPGRRILGSGAARQWTPR